MTTRAGQALNQHSALPMPDRFWAKVQKHLDEHCWLWMGSRIYSGYGTFYLNGHAVLAHRVAYELLVGAIPEGLTIDHLCRNRRCVNPRHMEPVTHAVNTLRGFSPSAVHVRKTHCPKGHPYSPENTVRRPNGSRKCRECQRADTQITKHCDNCGRDIKRGWFARHQRSEASRAA